MIDLGFQPLHIKSEYHSSVIQEQKSTISQFTTVDGTFGSIPKMVSGANEGVSRGRRGISSVAQVRSTVTSLSGTNSTCKGNDFLTKSIRIAFERLEKSVRRYVECIDTHTSKRHM